MRPKHLPKSLEAAFAWASKPESQRDKSYGYQALMLDAWFKARENQSPLAWQASEREMLDCIRRNQIPIPETEVKP